MSANGTASSGPPKVVLDTHVVLDWLLFADPRVAALAAAVQQGALLWTVCAPMRLEFERTLRSRALRPREPDVAALLQRFDRHACLHATPATLPALRCSDGDDQVFLDLAAAVGAQWLLTRDRALLRLARRAARQFGLPVVTPERWLGQIQPLPGKSIHLLDDAAAH